MNLDFSFLGYIHTLTSFYALWMGALLLWANKGGQQHRRRGIRYFVAMLIVNVSALGIFKLGGFTVFHWMAVVTLLALAVAFISARWQKPKSAWLRIHLTSMLISYYFLLGGALNEVLLRVKGLEALAKSGKTGALHGFIVVAILMVIAYFFGKTSRPAVQGNLQTNSSTNKIHASFRG